ncbi:hypothetical protein PRLR5107_21350 [Prevotella lacticifex]|uniref:TonB C-terminal domain-containing protein n=2 Tax=Prevotella lacticifex TaxID=2854755 RepID=A0A9R1CWI7_9BACT|nr:hypothetical protein [Prevotella sp.]GJG36977.1 hypothetical protein PRLR5003_21340 [Prevotella lacticifex]MDD6853300.1 hypothetical protein [Prevotella sp.]GJG40523.1 hypothetical protein PRLR5019_24940 [Prevotella lacticifex]GJG44220.1 hypothetical protein PRLR5025_30060 [Prevotella lacticifex]GJG46905.1 hypothetical protein PRLR5027_25000 [Prevotella lacticifex]
MDIAATGSLLYDDDHVEIQPSYPGGVDAFRSTLYKMLKESYTNIISETETIEVTIVIEKDGTASNINVDCRNKGWIPYVIKAIKAMPKWNPGLNSDYDPVRVKYEIGNIIG